MWLRLLMKQPQYKTAAFHQISSKDVKHVSGFVRAAWQFTSEQIVHGKPAC